MNKPITIEEAKNYDKTDYLNHMKEQSEARVNKAIEIINQIIGINYEEMVKRTFSKNAYSYCPSDFLLSYSTDELIRIYEEYRKEGFDVTYYKPHNSLFIKVIVY